MQKTVLLITVILFYSSCKNSSKPAENVATAVKDKKLAGAEQTVRSFYKWYLDYYFNNDKNIEPDIIIRDSILTIDTSLYFLKVRGSGFFSERYVEWRKKEIEECMKQLKKVPVAGVDLSESNAAELVEYGCDFMFYYDWLKHQGENTEGIRILKSEKYGEGVKVYLEQLWSLNPAKPNGFKLVVKLVKEDKWRIVDIERYN